MNTHIAWFLLDARIEHFMGYENARFFVGPVHCNGNEQYFNQCVHEPIPSGGCNSASVSCVRESGKDTY